MNGKRIFTILILLMPLIACALPGFLIPAAPQPTQTVDLADPIQTMVAATVSAAIAQTEQSVSSPAPAAVVIVTAEATITPTATSTIPATATSVPTATSMPSATGTSVSTITSTPGVTSPSQSALARQQDGSFLFVDNRAGYETKLPSGWLAVRVSEKEYQDAFSLAEAAGQHIQQALLGVQGEDPNILRLFAIDAQPPHIQNEFVSDMRFALDGGKSISLNSDVDLQAIAATIPASATVFRFEVTAVKLFTSASGVQFGVIETRSSFANNVGVDVPLYQKRVFFNTKGGIQSITLTTLADLKDTLLPAFDAMLETIKLNQN